MTVTYYFFDGQEIYQSQWSKALGKSLLDGVLCGVDNDLFCYGDASGMQVKVKSGALHIKGHYYFSDAEQILAIGAAPGTVGQSRYDLVVGEVDWTNKVMAAKIVQGTASASPAVPALTRSTTIWQIPLARVTVAYGDTNVPANKVLDLRTWALGTFSLPLLIGNAQTVIATGVMPAGVAIPPRAKVVKYVLAADATGSIVVDLWKDTSNVYPPTVADTICHASYKPTLSSTRTQERSVWNEATNINENGANWPGYEFAVAADTTWYRNILLANVDSAATVKQVCLSLIFARMAGAQS